MDRLRLGNGRCIDFGVEAIIY
jgi:hypothetical protein